MPYVVTDKLDLYALSDDEKKKVTHLHLAFNDLHRHIAQNRKKQDFLHALTTCTSLRYLNIQDNDLSAEEIAEIKESCTNLHVQYHCFTGKQYISAEMQSMPKDAYQLLDIARHWQKQYPHIVKFHRANKDPSKTLHSLTEMTVNSQYSVLILPDGNPVILLRTNMLSRKFSEYKQDHGNTATVAFGKYEPKNDAVSIKVGITQFKGATNQYIPIEVVIKCAFSTYDNNCFTRESIFTQAADIHIGLQRRNSWHSKSFAKDYIISRLTSQEDAHEWLSKNVDLLELKSLTPNIKYAISMILEVMQAHTMGFALLDVKPENFTLDGFYAKFIDFGSAHLFSDHPIQLAEETKTSNRYACQQLLDACRHKVKIIVNAQLDHYALAIVLREFLYPFSMLLSRKWYFHREGCAHIDTALDSHFFAGMQKNISDQKTIEMLQQYINDYPKHNFLEFAKHFFTTFSELALHVIKIRAITIIDRIKGLARNVDSVMDYLQSKHCLNVDGMIDAMQADQPLANFTIIINWLCKLQITEVYLVLYSSSTDLSSLKKLWGAPNKDISELDKPYEQHTEVESYLRKKLTI